MHELSENTTSCEVSQKVKAAKHAYYSWEVAHFKLGDCRNGLTLESAPSGHSRKCSFQLFCVCFILFKPRGEAAWAALTYLALS